MMRRCDVGAVLSAMLVAAVLAPAMAVAQPTSMAWTENKNDGTVIGGVLYTALNKPLSVDIFGTQKKSMLSVEISMGAVLGEGNGKDDETTVKLKQIGGIADGVYDVVVIETTEDGTVYPPVGGLTLIVDRVAPARPGLVHFAPETIIAMPYIEDDPEQETITPLVPMIIEAEAEPFANIYLVVNGKLKKPKLKTVERDRAGVVDADGDFKTQYQWVKSRTWEVVDGDPVKPATAKFKEGDNDIALVAVDRAGNVSQSSVPLLDFVVATKQPKTPKKIKPAGLTVRRNGLGWDVGSTVPVIMGFSKEAEEDVALLVDGVIVGTAETDDDGAFFVSPEDPLSVGPHQIEVVSINEEEIPSDPSMAITVNIFDGGIPPSLPEDDFNDDVTDLAIWTLVEPAEESMIAAEEGKKLQFPKVDTTARRGVAAGYLSNGWSLDLDQDFVITVKYKFEDKEVTGNTGLMLAVVESLDEVTGEVINGASAVVGTDNGGGYVSLTTYANKVQQDVEFVRGRRKSGDAYLAYTSLTDELFIGESLDDPNGLTLMGLKGLSPDNEVSVYIGSFATGQTPLTKGKDAWFDDFEVEEGEVILADQDSLLDPLRTDALPEEPSATELAIPIARLDVNGDGIVSSRDVDYVLQAMGAEGEHLAEDVDGDGVVTVRDLRAVLARLGLSVETSP